MFAVIQVKIDWWDQCVDKITCLACFNTFGEAEQYIEDKANKHKCQLNAIEAYIDNYICTKVSCPDDNVGIVDFKEWLKAYEFLGWCNSVTDFKRKLHDWLRRHTDRARVRFPNFDPPPEPNEEFERPFIVEIPATP